MIQFFRVENETKYENSGQDRQNSTEKVQF